MIIDSKTKKIIVFTIIIVIIAGAVAIYRNATGTAKPTGKTVEVYYTTVDREREMLYKDFETDNSSLVSASCDIKDNNLIVTYTYKKQQNDKQIEKRLNDFEQNLDSMDTQARKVVKAISKKTKIKMQAITFTLVYCNKDGSKIWEHDFSYI